MLPPVNRIISMLLSAYAYLISLRLSMNARIFFYMTSDLILVYIWSSVFFLSCFFLSRKLLFVLMFIRLRFFYKLKFFIIYLIKTSIYILLYIDFNEFSKFYILNSFFVIKFSYLFNMHFHHFINKLKHKIWIKVEKISFIISWRSHYYHYQTSEFLLSIAGNHSKFNCYLRFLKEFDLFSWNICYFPKLGWCGFRESETISKVTSKIFYLDLAQCIELWVDYCNHS